MIAEAHAKAALSRRGILTGLAIALAAVPVLPALAGDGSAANAFLADIYQRYGTIHAFRTTRSRSCVSWPD